MNELIKKVGRRLTQTMITKNLELRIKKQRKNFIVLMFPLSIS